MVTPDSTTAMLEEAADLEWYKAIATAPTLITIDSFAEMEPDPLSYEAYLATRRACKRPEHGDIGPGPWETMSNERRAAVIQAIKNIYSRREQYKRELQAMHQDGDWGKW